MQKCKGTSSQSLPFKNKLISYWAIRVIMGSAALFLGIFGGIAFFTQFFLQKHVLFQLLAAVIGETALFSGARQQLSSKAGWISLGIFLFSALFIGILLYILLKKQ